MLPMVSRMSDQNWFPTLFNNFFDDDLWIAKSKNVTAPAVNVIDADKAYKVEVAAPGMTKDDFHVKIDNENNLVISLEKRSDSDNTEKKNHKYLRREFSYSKYQQAFTLPDDVENDKITAKMTDGVLTIDIPKREPAPVVDTTRHIAIQ